MGAPVEPVPDAPAAIARLDGAEALVIADYHAGIEAGLRYERGVELPSQADARRDRLLALLDRTDPDRLVVLGDLGHRVGDPRGPEAEELTALVAAVTDRVPLTLVPGNHDGGVAALIGPEGDSSTADRPENEDRPEWADAVTVAESDGVRDGGVGFCHGHTWPARDLLSARTICIGHEHPTVSLTDEVGVSRKERAWLRGQLRPDPFAAEYGIEVDDLPWGAPELIVFPAFNDRSGGNPLSADDQFLSPFLPAALDGGEAYLLDGTRLGDYRRL
jgi:hypothetical protein